MIWWPLVTCGCLIIATIIVFGVCGLVKRQRRCCLIIKDQRGWFSRLSDLL